MLGVIYIYGHLVVAAFALTVAFAFFIFRLRLPQLPSAWAVVAFTLMGACALGEMAVTRWPSLVAARAQLSLDAMLICVIVIAYHSLFAREVLARRQAHRHASAVLAYAAWSAVLIALLLSGATDGDHLRRIAVGGIETATLAMRTWAFVICTAYVFTSPLITAPLMLRAGPRRLERRAMVAPVLALPLVGMHDLLVAHGINPMPPLGGYFAGISAMVGGFVLAERTRMLAAGDNTVGAYTIERRLGSGGMADVFLARRTNAIGVVQRVALKRLRSEHVDDPSFARMFIDEARIAARLTHPNIVTLLDVGEHRAHPFLAMELIDGAPLSRLLKVARQRASAVGDAAVVEVALQVADALGYAHAMTNDVGRPLGLVHRDVSPHNLLVARDGHVKLADFGIARSLDRDTRTRTGQVKGKLAYMAPEQVQSSRYDQRVDVYALGVVMFEMLANRAPYAGCSDVTIMRRLLEGDPEPYRRAGGLAAPLGPLVRWATDPDPTARPKSAAELRASLTPLRDETRGRGELRALVAEALDDSGPQTTTEVLTASDVRRATRR